MTEHRSTLAPLLRPLVRDDHERLGWRMAGGFVAGLLVIWLTGQAIHAQRTAEPPQPAATTDVLRADALRPVATRLVRFADVGRDLVAHDAETGSIVKPLGFEKDGFVVSIVRSHDRERKRLGLASGAPYRLTRWDNGQILLEDTLTGAQIEFTAFGATNVAAVASLLGAGLDAPPSTASSPGRP